MSLRTLAAAFAYFTIFPSFDRYRAAPVAAVFSYLPAIGIIIGVLSGYAAYGLALIGWAPLAIAAAFAFPILLTGALHVDGFLDSCDALFACVDPEKRLQIMKDPTHGTFAIAYFAVLVTVWIAALAMLPAHAYPAVLAFSGGAARWASGLSVVRYSYAGSEGFSIAALAANGVILAALSFAAGHWMWIALVLVALGSPAAGRWAAGRLNGKLTGDVYGALIVAGEVATLTACVALYGR
ncbi:MAG: adenosylcobinamide-GDP ribazoletransferase [Vulcanimicrobiaceae bacterium]